MSKQQKHSHDKKDRHKREKELADIQRRGKAKGGERKAENEEKRAEEKESTYFYGLDFDTDCW